MNKNEKIEIGKILDLLEAFHDALRPAVFGTPIEANRIWKELIIKLERLIK